MECCACSGRLVIPAFSYTPLQCAPRLIQAPDDYLLSQERGLPLNLLLCLNQSCLIQFRKDPYPDPRWLNFFLQNCTRTLYR
jgi:hypothetical protein